MLGLMTIIASIIGLIFVIAMIVKYGLLMVLYGVVFAIIAAEIIYIGKAVILGTDKN